MRTTHLAIGLAIAGLLAVAAGGLAEDGEPEPLADEIPQETFEEHDANRLDAENPTGAVPEPVTQVQPGSKILIDIVGHGSTRCTASWVVEDATGDYYIATAGHCVLPGDSMNPEIPFSSDPGYQGANVIACVANCTTETASSHEEYVALGDVLYAQYLARDNAAIGLGYDLAFIEIPKDHYDLVDTSMARWEGPTDAAARDEPDLGDVALQYGHGTGLGDAWLTEGRTGVYDGYTDSVGEDCHHPGDGCTATYAGAITPGDSGSPMAIGVTTETGTLVADRAAAITTSAGGLIFYYTFGVPVPDRAQTVWGTHIQQAMGLAENETGVDLSFTASDAELPTPAPAPVDDVEASNPGTGDELTVDWTLNRTTLPLDRYEIYRSQGSTDFADKSLFATTVATTLTDEDLPTGTTYCYQIVAVDENGQTSPAGEETCATTDKLAPPAPDVRADNPGLSGEISLSWTEPDHVRSIDHYVLERSADGADWIEIATTSERFHVDENLDEATPYRYRVTAVDADGLESPAAETEAVQPAADEPTWRQADRDNQGTSFTGATGDLADPEPVETELARPAGAAPRVADLDRDGTPDIVTVEQATDRDERVVVQAQELRDGALETRWSTTLPATLIAGLEPTAGTGGTAIADLDRDGTDEVVAYAHYRAGEATEDGAVHALDPATGAIQASYNGAIGFGTDTNPRIGDLTGDGAPEIVVLDAGPELIALQYENGDLQLAAAGAGSGEANSDPVLADFTPDLDGLEIGLAVGDADGGRVLVCGARSENVDCKTTGTLPAGPRGIAATTLEPVFTPSLVAHLDDEPGLAVRPTAPAGANATADVGALASGPAVGPLGPDGRPAVASGLADPGPEGLDPAGDLLVHAHEDGDLAPLDRLERPGSATDDRDLAGQVVADVNGDGHLDVLAVDVNGRVLAYTPSATGAGQEVWSHELVEPIRQPPVVADATGDGSAEVLVAGQQALTVLR